MTKRRRTGEDGASVPTAVAVNSAPAQGSSEDTTPQPSGSGSGKNKGEGKKPKKTNTPFQRVKAEQVTFADPRLKDNRFESRVRFRSNLYVVAQRTEDCCRARTRRIMGRVHRAISL